MAERGGDVHGSAARREPSSCGGGWALQGSRPKVSALLATFARLAQRCRVRPPTTYWDYIRVEEMLGLQGGLEPDDAGLSNDEVLFITVHQIDELWFKLVLRELVAVRNLFAQPHVPEQALASAVRGLRRTALLFQNVAQHFALMESMTTRDYLAFRDKLSPASGFQSAQLREIEILLGLESKLRLPMGSESTYMDALKYPDGTESPASRRVARRMQDKPSLRESIDAWLWRTPIMGSTPSDPNDADVVREFVEGYLASHAEETTRARTFAQHSGLTVEDGARLDTRYAKEREGARAFLLAENVEDADERARRSRIRAALVFLESYRELPLLAWPREVMEALVEMEQASLIFRQRHARMVERVIGRRTGTGGSAGVDYLDSTAVRYRVFDDVWAVRTLLVREAALPALKNASFYGLVAER
ncbi:MAG: tryptophan 2,3-dioxygenase [Sandaracinus sp.]|nr:tryptophan 2,3-dioxygenase [Sandaracinus sp.]